MYLCISNVLSLILSQASGATAGVTYYNYIYNYLYFLDHSRYTTDIDRGSRRASSRGIIPRAKVKTIKMTMVIVIGTIY